jgi:hypothetical protein
MPPPGYKSFSLTDDVINDIHRVHREVSAVGTRNLPKNSVPPEFRNTGPLTMSQVVKMAMLYFERSIKKR